MQSMPERRPKLVQPLVDKVTGWLVYGDWVTANEVKATLGICTPVPWVRACTAAGVTPERRKGMSGNWVRFDDARRMVVAEREKPP